MAVVPATRIYEGTRIPSPCPTILEIDPAKHDLEDILTVNFGPNHPSTHGVLRLIVDLDGERIAGIRAVIGYLHTGFEKTMEQKTYWKGITYPERIDYLSFQANELVFVLAIEKLLELETPEKATWMRMCLSELNRIHSHLVWLGTSALEIGAISMFWYAFRERDMVLDLFEMVTGVRMHTRYFQVGGLAEDIPEGFYAQARALARHMPQAVDDYEALLDRNKIWLERTKGIGLLSADDALALGQSGPMLRASGVDWDLRKATPYLALRRGRLRRARLPERRRLRPLQGAHGRDAHRRRASSPSASTGSRSCAASRGSPTTARSCCRRARSSTPRWSP